MANRITACGCSVPKGQRCKHEQARHVVRQATADRQRGSSSARGYTSKWATESKDYLASHPTCAVCGGPSQCVDHRIAHKGDQHLFWSRSNWQPMCIPCNSRKNVKHEGGFGRSS